MYLLEKSVENDINKKRLKMFSYIPIHNTCSKPSLKLMLVR